MFSIKTNLKIKSDIKLSVTCKFIIITLYLLEVYFSHANHYCCMVSKSATKFMFHIVYSKKMLCFVLISDVKRKKFLKKRQVRYCLPFTFSINVILFILIQFAHAK